MKKAFTLIELLVVVLIIGILAAVALPKYERSVMKSRYAGLKPVTRSLAEAEEVFYMANGSYDDSADLSNLDVQKPNGGEISVEYSTTSGHDYVRASHNKINNRYTQYLKHSNNFAGNIYCEADATDTKAQALCVAEGGAESGTKDGYKLYLISGTSTGSFGYSFVSSSEIPGGTNGAGPGFFYTYSDGENTMSVEAESCSHSGCTPRAARGRVIVRTCDAQNHCTTEDYGEPNYVNVNGGKPLSDLCTDYPIVCQ